MAKYDAAGDRVRKSAPAALWVMLLGLVVGVCGLIWCLNTDLKKYAKTENLYTDQDTGEIKNIDFEFDRANVEIKPSSDKQIHVSIENAPEGMYSYGQKDSTFYIHSKKMFKILTWSGISSVPFLRDVYPEAKIRIEIPSGLNLDKAEIDSKASDVTLNTVLCETLDIDNGMGEIKLVDCVAKKTTIDNGMGEIEINYCSLGKTDIENGMGRIKMKDCVADDTDIENGMGGISGSIKLKGDADIDNGLGDVDLTIQGDGEDFRLSGDDDEVDVKGKIGGRDAKYKIKVNNGLGDIDLSFKD